jgi:hypothetical protein
MDDRYSRACRFSRHLYGTCRKGLVFAELKTERGKLDPAQVNWLRTLDAAGAEVHVWRPSDMQAITNLLLTGTRP